MAFCLHDLQLSWHISNVFLLLSLGLTVAITDIWASHEQTEVSCSFGLLDFFLPNWWGFNSCLILGSKESIFQTKACHSKIPSSILIPPTEAKCVLHNCLSLGRFTCVPLLNFARELQLGDRPGQSFCSLLSSLQKEIRFLGSWSEVSQTCIPSMKLTDRWELNPKDGQLHWESKIISPSQRL